MTFTKEQMEILSAFEDNFRTALQSNYSRGIGTSGYTTMHRILKEATGTNLPFRPSCYSCMFRLVSTTGKLYMADKHEIEEKQEEEKKRIEEEEKKREVALRTLAEKEKVEKAVVKTEKPKTKKPRTKKPRTKKTKTTE